jgi:hypothetical protein
MDFASLIAQLVPAHARSQTEAHDGPAASIVLRIPRKEGLVFE